MKNIDMTEEELSYPLPLRYKKLESLFGFASAGLSPKSFLDIGCGTGTTTGVIRKVLHLDLVEGVDALEGKISCPDWLKVARLDIDKEDLPYPDGSFDVVFCGELIEHLVDPDHLLAEVYRLLSPTGFWILTTPNLASWSNRIVLPLGFQPFYTAVSLQHEEAGKFPGVRVPGHRVHLRVFTLRALKELLRLHHFKIKRVEGWETGDRLSTHLQSSLLDLVVRPIDGFLSRFPSLASRIAVLVTK